MRKHPWTLVHSFYAAMGGFVFETSIPIFCSRTRFVLTYDGVCFVMKHAPELIPDLSEASILDRSRSDSLGKALLIVQLLYFCISCAARLVQSLSLSLLEVSTLARAICGVATYFVWWKKPFDVAEPTVISGAHADEVAAFLLLKNNANKMRFLAILEDKCPSESHYLTISSSTQTVVGDPSEAAISVDEALEELDLRPGQAVQVGNFTFSFTGSDRHRDRYHVYGSSEDSLPWFQRRRGPNNSVRLDKEDFTRWRLVERPMARFRDYDPRSRERTLLSWEGGLRHSLFFEPDSGELLLWSCMLSTFATLYGSCHFLGRDAVFPTSQEYMAWRAGGLTMVAIGTIPFILGMLELCASILSNYHDGLLGYLAGPLIIFVGGPILVFIGAAGVVSFVVYPAIGLFLLGDSFRQLFFLPDSAFQLPDLSVYLPHIA